jgi:hypothetical protein
MSMVMQNHLDYYDRNGSIEFKRLLEEFIQARKQDIDAGNPECEHDDKVSRIQQITGVNLRKV